jgi:twitching motility protein PilI
MAKKEALRELQNRLAGRLQSARTEVLSVAWLAVLVGKNNYLLPLTQAGEIFPLGSITRVPYAQPWFTGVINLRGGLYGVVDLASFLGDAVLRTGNEQSWAEARLVTFNVELEINCALMVDGLVGLRRQDAFTGFEPPPEGGPAFLGNRFMDSEGRKWQEIDLRLLSQTSRFLSIGA